MRRELQLGQRMPIAAWITIAGAALLTISACTVKKSPPDGPTPAAVHMPPVIDTACSRLGWSTCPVWERTDDQRLNDGTGKYGPFAFIVPHPLVDTRENFNDAGRGVISAAVFIKQADTLPIVYRDLQVNSGWNCVYLREEGGVWRAAIFTAPSVGPVNCQPAGWADQQLRVIRLAADIKDSVPGVARFHEGKRLHPTNKDSVLGQPLFGVACGKGWCIILPDKAAADTVEMPRPPGTNWLTWRVYGWGDSQHLALQDSTTGELYYSDSIWASIVAVPGLRDLDLEDNPEVAAVWFETDPTGTLYATKWGFKRGWNMVSIQKPKNPERNWPGAGTVKQKMKFLWWYMTTRTTGVIVNQKHHGHYVPASARFRWEVDDEGLWVRCDDGCCQVSAG